MGEITKGVFGLNNYVICFYDDNDIPNDPQKAYIKPNYYRAVSRDRETFDRFRTLEEKDFTIDTDLEFALASYYSPALVQIRPPEAAAILPENNKTSGLKLASAVLHKLAEVKFLTPQDKDAVGRYEGMVKFIQDKHGLSRAEIDKYYRDAVRAETAEAVAIEFNKVFFDMDRTYNATLMLDSKSGKYTLSYEDAKKITKEISGVSLDALLSAMGKNGLNQACINTVRSFAGKLPAITYARWKAEGSADALELVTDALTNFYTNPCPDTFNTLIGIRARYRTAGEWYYESTAGLASLSFCGAIVHLQSLDINAWLSHLVIEKPENTQLLAAYPSDPRYDVFGKR